MNPKNMDLISNVNRDWFTSNRRALVFSSMKNLYTAGQTIDLITIKSKIADSKFAYKNDTIKDIDLLFNDKDINPADFESYQVSLEEKFLQRIMALSLQDSITKIQSAEIGFIKETIDEIESDLFNVSQSSESFSNTVRIGDIGINYMNRLREIKESGIPPFVSVLICPKCTPSPSFTILTGVSSIILDISFMYSASLV